MPTPPIAIDVLRKAVRLVESIKEEGYKGSPIVEAARRAGVPRQTMARWYSVGMERLAERGELGFAPVLPGYHIKSTSQQVGDVWVKQTKAPGDVFTVPDGHLVKGVSALIDSDGRTLAQWIKTREGPQLADTIETIKAAFADYESPARPVKAPVIAKSDLLTLVPANDWHVGMFAWGKETGENWDLKIAERTIGAAVEDVITRSPSSDTAVVLGGGDLLHADNKTNQTAKSGNLLDVDGRYQKVLMTGSRLMVRTVDASLRQHRNVIVRVLPGNHDEHAAVAIAYFLLAWYRNEPRVTVDIDPSLFWWFRFDRVLLGATHGHEAKLASMPGIMAQRRPADWGETQFRYAHGFHYHNSQKMISEAGGVTMECHQAPIPQDAWHFGKGYLSGRSVQAITYHGQYGEIGRVRTAVLDASQ